MDQPHVTVYPDQRLVNAREYFFTKSNKKPA